MKIVNVKSHTRKGYCVPETKVSNHTRRVSKSNSKATTNNKSISKKKNTTINLESKEKGSLRAPTKIMFDRNSNKYENIAYIFAMAGNSIKFDSIKKRMLQTKVFPPSNKGYKKGELILFLTDEDITDKPITSSEKTLKKFPKIIPELKEIIKLKNIKVKKGEGIYVGVIKFKK